MIVEFTKMHSLGNDFVVLDLIGQYVKLYPALIERIADRNLGIGCDQVLTIEPPIRPDVDFFYRVFNQDGKEVEQCGNGVRCLAQLVLDRNLSGNNKLIAECKGGSVSLHILKNRQVSVCFNVAAKEIDIINTQTTFGDFELHCVNLGNPHGILFLDKLERGKVEYLEALGSELSSSFQTGCNIGFCQVINKQEISLQVYERGVGLTAACGTGALAAMLCAFNKKLISSQVKVHFQSGYLKVQYQTEKKSALMAGPTTTTFTGNFRL